MYDEAIEKLKKSTSVRVFAPTNLWWDHPDKEKWIQALCDFKGDKIMVYGDGNTPMQKALVSVRTKKLKDSGMKLHRYGAQQDPKFGFILFDNCGLAGLGNRIEKICGELEMEVLSTGFRWVCK